MTLALKERLFRTLLPVTKLLEERISCLPDHSEESEELWGAVTDITEGLLDLCGVPPETPAEEVSFSPTGDLIRPDNYFVRDGGYCIIRSYKNDEISLDACYKRFKIYLYELNKSLVHQ